MAKSLETPVKTEIPEPSPRGGEYLCECQFEPLRDVSRRQHEPVSQRLAWTGCPVCRGLSVQFGLENAIDMRLRNRLGPMSKSRAK